MIESGYDESQGNRVLTTRFQERSFVTDPKVHIRGDAAIEGLMRTTEIVPLEVEGQLASYFDPSHRGT